MIPCMSERYPRQFDQRRVLPLVLGFLPIDVVRSNSVVPIKTEEGGLGMAVPEGCDDETLDNVLFIGNKEFNAVVVTNEALKYAIERYCAQQPTGNSVDDLLGDSGVA